MEIKCQLDATDEFLLQILFLAQHVSGHHYAHHHTDNLKTKAPNTTGSNHLYNTLELLMTGIMVPETCWARNTICNKNSSVASSWQFYFHILSTMHGQNHIKFKMCFLSTNFVWNISHFKKNSRKYFHKYTCEVPVILVRI